MHYFRLDNQPLTVFGRVPNEIESGGNQAPLLRRSGWVVRARLAVGRVCLLSFVVRNTALLTAHRVVNYY